MLYKMCNMHKTPQQPYDRHLAHVQSTDARRRMREILSAVERGDHIEIRRYDTPTAVVVPIEWYDRAKTVTWKREPESGARKS
jgi:prevent-host-death family protein